ncbi:hypothetical protein V2J09_022198 [Rumex salicifolius]
MEISRGEVDLEYFWRWQVPICALIITTPAVICLNLIKKKLKEGNRFSHGCLWVPCWRGLNPEWLLLYRILAFISMAWLLYRTIAVAGIRVFYFYTQWTFTLVMAYFAIGVIMSAHGCWFYKVARSTAKVGSNNIKEQFKLENVSAGASILTDIVFWCVLVPMLSGKEFKLTLVIGLIHFANIAFLVIDSFLNNLSFEWFGLTYFAWWSVIYITFQWSLHAYGFTRYLGLALLHFPCHGIYIILMKATTWACSRLFPRSYMRYKTRTLIATGLLVNIGKSTLTTVVAIKVIGHESSSAALSIGTLLPQPLDLAGVINLVELENSELDLLVLVLDLLGLGVSLLLPLLGATAEAEDQVELGEGAAVLELLSGEDEPLLVRRNTFLVLDLRLHIVDRVRGFNL